MDASLSVVAVTQSMSLFLGLMPGPDAILTTDSTDVDQRQRIRVRETAAVAMSLGSGILLAAIAKDPSPFYVALAVSLTLALASEFLIHISSPEYMKGDNNGNAA